MATTYDPDHFSALFDIEDRHFWFIARNLALRTVIEGITPRLAPGYRVLEVGCGTGNTLGMLQAACPDAGMIVGMDPFAEGLEFARRRSSLPLVRGSIDDPPFAKPFDMVAIFDVLEHLDDDWGVLKKARGLLTPGGCLLVTVPARKALWGRFDEESHHRRRYERDELGERIEAAGFRLDYLTHFMAALYPIARVSRYASDMVNSIRRRMRMEQRSAVLSDIRVLPIVNGALRLALRQEIPLLRRRRQIAIGTSLLAMARPLIEGADCKQERRTA